MKKNILFVTFITFFVLSFNSASGQTTVVMNEIFARGAAADLDWIELYNPASSSVNLSGYKIYDSGGQSGIRPKLAFPAGAVLPAKGFYVIVTDIADTSGFGLSGSGEKVWLENASGSVIDTITFGDTPSPNESYGRMPDGGTWGVLTTITKGKSNTDVAHTTVIMNEIFARGTAADPDWIEVYNPLSSAVDISGYKIYDSGAQSGTKAKRQFPAGTTIPSKGFAVIVTDVTDADGFGLSSGGEKVWLENAAGTVIDTVTFGATAAATESYGRNRDGGAWGVLSAVTKGKTNNTTGVKKTKTAVKDFTLGQNYPNPFNPSTVISYSIPEASNVRLSIYNVLGIEIAAPVNQYQSAGSYTLSFSASDYRMSAGIYFYTLNAGKYSITRKMILSK